MIRMLLVLVLAQFVVELQSGDPGLYSPPALTSKHWRGGGWEAWDHTAAHHAEYMIWAYGNAARSARIVGTEFPWLQDIDTYMDTDTITWHRHYWCPLGLDWCFSWWAREDQPHE